MQQKAAAAAPMRSGRISFSRKKFSKKITQANAKTMTIRMLQTNSHRVPISRISGRKMNMKGMAKPQTASRMEMRLVFMKSPFASPEATSAPIATGGVTAESSP